MPGRSRRRSSAQIQRRDRLALAALATLVIVAPELMGGKPAWAVVAIALLVTAALGLVAYALVRAPEDAIPRHIVWVVSALGALVVLTGLQAMPLPLGVVERLAEDVVADLRAIEQLGIAMPGHAAYTPTPILTRRALLMTMAATGAFTAAYTLSSRGARDWVVRFGGATTVCVAAVCLAHAALAVRQPFGMVAEPWWSTPFIGPLLNGNHLAGFLAMGVPLLLGSALEAERGPSRTGWLVAAALTAAVSIVCLSRGGIASLAVGLAIFAALVWARSRERSAGMVRALIGAITAVGIAGVVAVSYALDGLRDELEHTTLDKLRVAARGLDLTFSSPWLGVGRGAFSVAFVRLFGIDERIENPENLIVQWTSEWGLVVGGGALVVLGLAWARSALAARSPAQIGALAAVASIAAHDMVDFALEMPGIAVVASVALGAALAPSGDGSGWRLGSRSFAALGAIAGVATIALAPSVLSLDASSLQRELVGLLERREFEAFDARIAPAVRAHPAEPVFPLLAGHAAAVRDDARALRWLNRTMQLAPGWPEPHRITARWLAQHGSLEQAWLEVREVHRRQPSLTFDAGCFVLRVRPDAAAPIRVFGDAPAVLDSLARCEGAPDETVAALDEALRDSGLEGPHVRRARRAVARGALDEAIATLSALEERSLEADWALADALLAANRPGESAELLARSVSDRGPDVATLQRLADARARAGDLDGMRTAVQGLVALAAGNPTRVARARLTLARLELAAGNRGRALRALEDANRIDPSCGAIDQIATLAEQLGDAGRARIARMQICGRDGPASASCRH